MTDNWQKLGDITKRITKELSPIMFAVILNGPVADAVRKEAKRSGNTCETVIAEAVRSYLGDAA